MTATATWRLALALLFGGGAALFLAEAELLRVLSAVVTVAGIAVGVFAIATPEFLSADAEEVEPRGEPR